MSKKNLNWNDRFALMDHYKPSDDQACSAFGVSQDELRTARDMRSAGAFTASPNIDTSSYSNLFASASPAPSTPSAKTATRRGGSTSTSKEPTGTKTAAPVTATKKSKEPKKRGRKGDNIAKAFAAIPSTPTPVEAFAANHGVSIAVLRQSKRFDGTGLTGAVRVKKDKESKTLMIWREESK